MPNGGETQPTETGSKFHFSLNEEPMERIIPMEKTTKK